VASGIAISRVALPELGIYTMQSPFWFRLHVLTAEVTVGAVAHAASGETIRLAASCQYVLTAALPAINGNLSIEGSGATLERSDTAGTPDFSILTVNSADISVSNLNFRNG
jgi:hypothetical protein